jgi:hypothetical protein
MATKYPGDKSIEAGAPVVSTTYVHPKDDDGTRRSDGSQLTETENGIAQHGQPELVGGGGDGSAGIVSRGKQWFAYIKTKQFWALLVFG